MTKGLLGNGLFGKRCEHGGDTHDERAPVSQRPQFGRAPQWAIRFELPMINSQSQAVAEEPVSASASHASIATVHVHLYPISGRCLDPIIGHPAIPRCPRDWARDDAVHATRDDQRIGGGLFGCTKSLGGKELTSYLTVC